MSITERDELGRIKKGGKRLSSQEAADLAARRWEKPVEDNLAGLLEEAGYSEGNPAPTLVRLMGEQIARGGSGAVAAAREFIRLTRQPQEMAGNKPEPGSVCPTCGQVVITAEQARFISHVVGELARARREQGESL